MQVKAIVLVLMLMLSACGGRQVLRPQDGKSLPVKPAAARTAPTADALVLPDDQARPQRNEELVDQSNKRGDDPFNLPPKR